MNIRGVLLGATALAGALAVMAGPAAAQQREYSFDLPPQPLDVALREYARAANQQLIFADRDVRGHTAPALSGSYSADEALQLLLAGTELRVRRTASGVVQVAADTDPQSGSAAGGGAEVEALIVTAQKREENIQDVPIAISAFSQKDLEEQKIEGGFDLLKAIPNVTFSKNNFTSYNFSIRGVGTKAVSATTDPGVSVSFNNTGLIQNRLFEQEYFDIERVEVLRGPQGTLYGRNATSGVINVISAKPHLSEFDGWVKAEVGNYDSKRASAMVNIPLVNDTLALRLAGAFTDRKGYDYNSVTQNAVNGRQLWSLRATLGFELAENFRGDLLWERFEEDDDRLRTGKQFCHRDPGKEIVGTTPTYPADASDYVRILRPPLFSTGCMAGSLYDEKAFGTPNGLAIPFIYGVAVLGYAGFGIGSIDGQERSILNLGDPYDGLEQSHDLRTIASFRDPRYQAQADLFQLNLEYDLSDALTLYSQTAYNDDKVYSFQDFNRFNTAPVFTDTSQLTPVFLDRGDWREMAPGGVFCDPQLGCSETMAGFDISSASAEQFSQEIRLQSDFDGPLNFSAGANYTTFDVLVDYYIMFNIMTAAAMIGPFNHPINGQYDIGTCSSDEFGYALNWFFMPASPVPSGSPGAVCPYVDPNPVESINGEGHNYFRSKNPYELESSAAFGELYWQVNDATKVTAGLRYTNDKKRFVPVPSQVLLAPDVIAGGTVSRGYPELPPIKQEWGEWSGRLGVDWKPDLGFTDETLLYAFYSRGYKGGGANPPKPGFATEEQLRAGLIPPDVLANWEGFVPLPILELTADEYADTFEPEFVNAFEIGAKNTLLGGAMTFNTTAFYYDYDGYQVSQIRDRTAVNENFDAKVWGLEFETMFAPSRNLQIVANLGYLDTEIADGETSIDIMNRTQGDPNYIVTKGWLQLPSNCVVPLHIAELFLQKPDPGVGYYWQLCGGFGGPLGSPQFPAPNDPLFGNTPYDVENYPELNGGAGLLAELGGNELPNAPHWTANIGAQYGFDFAADWRVTFRTDAYWQSQSYHRVYNYEPYDKLHGWYNLNLSVWVERPDDDLKIEFYVKNALDKTPITDAFLNSDDTGLTTNVFFLDPRLIGLSIRKGF